MFREAEYFVGGTTNQAVLKKYPDAIEMMAKVFPVINSVEVLLRLQEQYPEAWALCADAEFAVAVSFTEEVEAIVGRRLYDIAGLAEHHLDGGAIFSLNLRSGSAQKDVLETVQHELAHARDMASGRLSVNAETLKVTWEGVVYDAYPLPARDDELAKSPRYNAQTIVSFARYFAQPWEASANEGLWGKEFPHVKEMIATYGTTWKAEWDAHEEEIVTTMCNFKVSLYEAVTFLLGR